MKGWRRVLSVRLVGDQAVTQAKIALSSSRDIPFNQLVLSQANVRRVKAGVSIEELAADIARRTLLQSLTVRAVLGEDGAPTGMYEIPAGGRRYRALELLVKQKRLARTAPVPCVIREAGIAEEDSLAENVQRAPLHPLDQFRAFLALREKGQSEEEIAAAFFVSVAVVRQRLKLASVSPKLLEAYAEDQLTLDQLMAFTVNGDHERQEQVFERLSNSYSREPYAIRRMLTEGAVRACDKRVQFIGVDAYVEVGGTVLHDLFQGDDGGWLQDVSLVERLTAERLEQTADAIRAEGWKWTEIAVDLPYDHAFGLRRLRGEQPALTEEQAAGRELSSTSSKRWKPGTSRSRSCRRTSTSASPNWRRRLPRSTTGRSSTIRRRPPGLGLSSASIPRAVFGSSAGSSGLRTRRQSSPSRRL